VGSYFDELAKALAGGVSRREALRLIAGGFAGSLLAAVGVGMSRGQGTTPPARQAVLFCQQICAPLGPGPQLGQCARACVACFQSGGTPCPNPNPTAQPRFICCPAGTTCTPAGTCA